MKKVTVWILTLMLGLSLTGCGEKKEPPVIETETDIHAQMPKEQEFSFSGTVFTYRGKDFDLSERGLTDILAVSPVGDVLMIEGELGPENPRYFLYDTVNDTMQEELMGSNMIWQEGDLDTAVYVFGDSIYRLDGTPLGQLKLEDNEFVYDLSFTDAGDAVTVTVINTDGETRNQEIAL